MKPNYHIQKYSCTLLTPLVIKNYSGSEIKVDTHDFISGNKFLGIVAAALYKKSSEAEALDLFHNGNVQYGNAYLSKDGISSYPVPGTLYAQDANALEDGYYLSGIIEKEQPSSIGKTPKKYSQIRTGYLIPETEQEYSRLTARRGERLKSAYDIDNRSSLSGNMFLYQYLEKGQQFVFEIRDYKNGRYLDRIHEVIDGDHYIATGKGEFGKISIESIGAPVPKETPVVSLEGETIWVYAHSDLAYIDNYGMYSWQPTAADLGFTNAQIDYEQSRLWFDRYTVRNGKRRTIDPERMIIKKGSVFALTAIDSKEKMTVNPLAITKGVGVHLAEGLGRIIVNPEFLNANASFSSYKKPEEETSKEEQIATGVLGAVLTQRYDHEQEEIVIYEKVLEFIERDYPNFKKISSSQWGAIRNEVYEQWYQGGGKRRKENILYSLFDTKEGFIAKSKKNSQWSASAKAKLEKLLEDHGPEALLLCTIEMPKHQKSTS
jgi:hypothetical protein